MCIKKISVEAPRLWTAIIVINTGKKKKKKDVLLLELSIQSTF